MARPGRPARGSRAREDLARCVVAALRDARRSAGVTQLRLAEMSGVSGHTLAKIEQAVVTDPGFAVVAALAGALGLSLDDLLRQANDMMRKDGRVPLVRSGQADRIKE